MSSSFELLLNECVVDCPTGYKSVEMEGDSNN